MWGYRAQWEGYRRDMEKQARQGSVGGHRGHMERYKVIKGCRGAIGGLRGHREIEGNMGLHRVLDGNVGREGVGRGTDISRMRGIKGGE